MVAVALKALAALALSADALTSSRRSSREGEDLVAELADNVLGNKQKLLAVPFEIAKDRDVGYVGELPILDNSTTEVRQESLGTTREVDNGLSPNIAIGSVLIKDSDQPPAPPSAFRSGGSPGGLDVVHLNGAVNPTSELTVWQWQRNKWFGLKKWLDAWITRFPDKLVVVHSAGDVLYGGCDEATLQYKYEQIVGAGGGTQKIVLAAEVSPYPSDVGWKYAASPWTESRRLAALGEWGVPPGWASAYANCTGEQNSLCDSGTPKYQYANGGFIMGPATDVLIMLEGLSKYTGLENRLVAEYFFEHPDLVTLDYAGVLSMSLHNMVRGGAVPVEVKTEGGSKILESKVTNQKVCFVHGNGNSYGALRGLAEQLKL